VIVSEPGAFSRESRRVASPGRRVRHDATYRDLIA